jgi:hypothetical protein
LIARITDVACDATTLIASCAMELQISMIPAPEDPPWRSDDYQSELRNLGLKLRSDGLELRDVGTQSAREGCIACISGEWRVNLGATLGSVLGVPVGSWLQARRGRTVRLIVGEIEADVRTTDELLSVIKTARAYQEVAESET